MPIDTSLKPPKRSPVPEPEMLTRFAPSAGSKSWNHKSRTLRATIAAGAGVERYDYEGRYLELLDPSGVELSAHMPVLNAHRAGDLSDVLGAVVSVDRKGENLDAVLRLSKRQEVDAIAVDIADGIVTGVSIGYLVIAWTEATDEDGNRTKTATKWRLLEVSIVPIPADDAARIRGRNIMSTTTTTSEAPDRDERAERKRLTTIRELGEHFGQRAFAAEHEIAGTSVEDFRAALIDRLADEQQRQAPTQSVVALSPYTGMSGGSASLHDPAFRTEAMGEAIAVRALPGLEPSPAARQFVGLSLPELAREHLRLAGEDVRGLTPAQVVTRSLGGLHSTSDFSYALSSAVGRVLRKTYEEAPSGLKPLARRLELADFRARTVVGLSGMSALEKVGEHGEFKRGTISDSGEKIAVEPFGKIFGVTRQVLVNDDLGWVADIPRKLGVAAAQFEAKQLAALLTSNLVMGDGKPVFHSDHGNVAAAGAALSETTLSAARLAMRKQVDEAGELIGIGPRYLIVGPELETDAEKLMAAITATDTSDVQPIRLTVAVEPRLTGKQWFVAADPASIDGIAYAHLANEPGPQLTYRNGFDVDGVEFKVRLDFGCAFLDWRSWYKNPGQA